MTVAERSSPRAAYDTLADDYDRLTAHHDYTLWVGHIDACLRQHGVGGRALLDVGCGTGRSTAAWRDAGYQVVGADVSVGMLSVARTRLPDVEFHHADLRQLPALGRFDVVSCLCDVVNSIAAIDLGVALEAVAARLRDDGLLVFDANTLHAYRAHFAGTEIAVDEADRLMIWRGGVREPFSAGETATLTIESFRRDPASTDAWSRSTSTQRQHHHPPTSVERAVAAAGLTLIDVYGQGFDAVPQRPLDEDRHTKALYIARRAAR
jgi:SAM-dependent methyltransferase